MPSSSQPPGRRAATVYSAEDLADGTTYGGVRVENPFSERRRVSESRPDYAAARGPWDDGELLERLARYEDACRDAGMRPERDPLVLGLRPTVPGLEDREYRPRGTTSDGRPVPGVPVTTEDLERQAAAYASAIEAAGREQTTVDTYHRHAMFFIRWLRGEFQPGRRLR